MHGATIQTVSAQQTKLSNNYKNTRLKLLNTNAEIWFNKMCKVKQLKPNYINVKINSKSLSVLNCNFSKEQSTLPEDDRMIETCRSVLSVLM